MPANVVIADDEPMIRVLLSEILEPLEDDGVTVRLARDGQEALEAIRAERPRLVFLDVMMPKLDGFEVCRIVKQELKLVDTNIVLVTAKGENDVHERGRAAGADDYINKPFNPEQIRRKTREVFGL